MALTTMMKLKESTNSSTESDWRFMMTKAAEVVLQGRDENSSGIAQAGEASVLELQRDLALRTKGQYTL